MPHKPAVLYWEGGPARCGRGVWRGPGPRCWVRARGVDAIARRRLGTPAGLSDQGRRHRSRDGRTQERPGGRWVRSRCLLVAAGSFSIPRYRGRPAHRYGVAMSIFR